MRADLLSSEHPLVGGDKVPRHLAEDGAPAILDTAPEVLVTPCAAPRRIVRRADHVREVEKRVTHRELTVPHRLHPPRVDAGEKVRMGDEMRVEGIVRLPVADARWQTHWAGVRLQTQFWQHRATCRRRY